MCKSGDPEWRQFLERLLQKDVVGHSTARQWAKQYAVTVMCGRDEQVIE
jgi:hypothetical protein